MRALFACLALFALTADAAGRFDRFNSRCVGGRSDRGLPCDDYAFFEFAPASGAGMGAVCACTTPTGAKGEAVAFARNSVGECPSVDGQSYTQCATNLPRVTSGSPLSTTLGVLSEPTRANYMTYSRDASNAAWTKTNMTCVKNATGMRGGANTASTCTATADNATVCQTPALGSNYYSRSIHLKRSVGTGAVSVSPDASTYYTVAIDSSWRRAVAAEAVGCYGSTCLVVPELYAQGTNPSICIKLATSGDSVLIDFAQIEAGYAPTTPIETTGVGAFRYGETINIDLGAGSPLTGVGSFAFSVVGPVTQFYPAYLALNSAGATDTTSSRMLIQDSLLGGYLECAWVNNAGTKTYASYAPVSRNGRSVCTFAGSGAISGSSGINSNKSLVSQSGAFAAGRYLQIGGMYKNTDYTAGGVFKRICIDPATTRCLNDDSTTIGATDVVWFGDSIVAGANSYPLTAPDVLQARLGSSRKVHNAGIGSDTVAQCGARYTALKSSIPTTATIVWDCAVNDLNLGTAGATLATAAQVFLADMRSRGNTVLIGGVTPWNAFSGSTAGKQVETTAYNSAMSTWAGSNGATYVSTDSLGSGSPLALTAANDSGDGLHLSFVGARAFADLINAGSP